MSIGIYIHLPICISRCLYCDFYSQTDMSLENQLVNAICTEISLRKAKFDGIEIDTIYLGGGTPSCFTTASIERILNNIESSYDGKVSELTIEVNPDDLISSKLSAYKDMGVNRVSLGFQSFNDNELRFLERRHNSNQNYSVYNLCRNAGFDNISIDLIFGLPNQRLNDLEYSLKRVVELHPEHLSLYGLSIEPNTKLAKLISEGRIIAIEDKVQSEMQIFAGEYLNRSGYNQYEISNFSLPGFECKHNLNYWKLGEYLGFGPSAHSFLSNKRWSNPTNIHKYMASLENGNLCISFEETITHQKAQEEFIMLSLRLRKGLNTRNFHSKFGIDIMKTKHDVINNLISNELLELKEESLIIPEKALPVSDEIISYLL